MEDIKQEEQVIEQPVLSPLEEQLLALQEELAEYAQREAELQAIVVSLTKQIKDIQDICNRTTRGGREWQR
jgi:hypothetical protein